MQAIRLHCQTTGQLLSYAASHGLDVEALTAEFGLDTSAVGAAEVDIDFATRAQLFRVVGERLNDPEIGVSLAMAVAIGRNLDPGEFALRSPDLRTAAEMLMRASGLRSPLTRFAVAEHETAAVVTHWVHGDIDPGPEVGDFVIAYMVRVARLVTGKEFPLRYAWFMRSQPVSSKKMEALLGTRDLRYGCRDRGICFDASLLRTRGPSAPVGAAPPGEASTGWGTLPPTAPAPSVPVATRARAIIAARETVPSEDELAKSLRMSVRTLRRRLAAENTSFRYLREETLMRRAHRLLTHSHESVEQIAQSLGYKYATNLSRAFRRAYGLSPAQVRLATRPLVEGFVSTASA